MSQRWFVVGLIVMAFCSGVTIGMTVAHHMDMEALKGALQHEAAKADTY